MNLHRRILALLPSDESGQSMVEYALVTALIAVVALVAVQTLGEGIVGVFETITDEIGGI
ncbi:MAG: Flp family type IVb pilin [Dehalococcoidia bacterium]|nr:Flp family type IVb pilin [Dehalococcoidia bacterium]